MAKGITVEFQTLRGPACGYVMGMVHGKGRPGVIVIQEWWGLVPHVRDVVNRFAHEGFDALAPDLYHGKSTVDAEEAHHLMETLDWPRAVDEIGAAVDYLRNDARSPRVGIVGFCMGGALAVLAAHHPGVNAYASFYGFPPDPSAILPITVPGALFFGEKEDVFSVPNARAFADAQARAGIPTEVVVYPGAGHAFFNDARPEVFHPVAAKTAWSRTVAHFNKHVKGFVTTTA